LVGTTTWLTLPEFNPHDQFDPTPTAQHVEIATRRHDVIARGVLIAELPPLGLLAFGAALVWAIRGFRR
jgi:hypothetical protein